jgi:hypothetical protein
MTNDELKVALQKRIDSLGQWQGFCFIPMITGVVLPALRREPVPPERAHIVALFHLGVIIVCWGAWGFMQWKKVQLKAQLRALDAPPQAALVDRPPIPPATG